MAIEEFWGAPSAELDYAAGLAVKVIMRRPKEVAITAIAVGAIYVANRYNIGEKITNRLSLVSEGIGNLVTKFTQKP